MVAFPDREVVQPAQRVCALADGDRPLVLASQPDGIDHVGGRLPLNGFAELGCNIGCEGEAGIEPTRGCCLVPGRAKECSQPIPAIVVDIHASHLLFHLANSRLAFRK